MMSEVRRSRQEIQALELEMKKYKGFQHSFPHIPSKEVEKDGCFPPVPSSELVASWQQRTEVKSSLLLLEALWKAGVGQTQQSLA